MSQAWTTTFLILTTAAIGPKAYCEGLVAGAATKPLNADACGIYAVDSIYDRIEHSLTDFKHRPNHQIYYHITNPNDPEVRQMLIGSCYCVLGYVSADPSNYGDRDYHLLRIVQAFERPSSDCSSQ